MRLKTACTAFALFAPWTPWIGSAAAQAIGPGYCQPVMDDASGRPYIQYMNGRNYIVGHHTWADHDHVCFNAYGIDDPIRPPRR